MTSQATSLRPSEQTRSELSSSYLLVHGFCLRCACTRSCDQAFHRFVSLYERPVRLPHCYARGENTEHPDSKARTNPRPRRNTEALRPALLSCSTSAADLFSIAAGIVVVRVWSTYNPSKRLTDPTANRRSDRKPTDSSRDGTRQYRTVGSGLSSEATADGAC